MKKILSLGLGITIFFAFTYGSALAAEPAKQPQAAKDNSGQLLEVDKVKKSYWTKGDDTGLRVVQNRTFSKKGKFEFGIFAGSVSSDPFLTVRNLGALFGYFFSEEIGFNVTYWKNLVSDSTALTTLQSQTGATANTNKPDSFYGGELTYSPIYGKLSVRGKMIIYYDFHLLGGVGMTQTETGNYITPLMGLGQQIYVAKKTILRLNYRLAFYKEDIKEKVSLATRGRVIGSRSSFNDVITLGVTQLFN